MKKLNPTVLGAFIVGAMALGLAALLAFGSSRWFREVRRFVVYFHEPISGLVAGGTVKMEGVNVGRVVKTSVLCNLASGETVVKVLCEVDRNVIRDRKGNRIAITAPDVLPELLEKGLRAKISFEGITGRRYVGLAFLDPERHPAREPPDWVLAESDYAVIPDEPSTISEFTDNLSEIVSEFREVNVTQLASDVRSLFETIDGQIARLDERQVFEKFAVAADSINRLAESEETHQLLTNANMMMRRFERLAAQLDAEIQPTASELKQTLESIEAAAAGLNTTFGRQSGLSSQAFEALERISAAAEAVRRLADFLERNPRAIITGRQPARE